MKLTRQLGRPVLPMDMQLSVGEYNAFEVLTHWDAQNKYDTWCKDYYTICKQLLPVEENYIDPKVVALVPNSQSRGIKLVKGYHYNPQTIECVNVGSIVDGSHCILLRVECLSLTKAKVIHTVHAVF